MYENHAFGDATLDWADPVVAGDAAAADVAAAVAWLREGHARLRRSIADLTDADLGRPRMTNWGEPKETRLIVAIMIQHDLYHAGEINHVRTLYEGEDRWAHERAS